MKSASIPSTTDLIAAAHPFVDPAVYRIPGFPMAINVRNRELIGHDWYWLKKAGLIDSGFVQLFGRKGCGKSTIAKLQVVYGRMRRAEGTTQMKIVINDRKPEGEDSEYGPLARRFNSKVFVMGSMRVNPFERKLYLDPRFSDDRSLYELGILNVAKLLCEYEDGPLMVKEYTALRVAVFEMLRSYDEHNWSPLCLQRICASLNSEILQAYHEQLDEKLLVDNLARMELVSDGKLKAKLTQEHNMLKAQPMLLQFGDLRSAAISVAARLGNVLHGRLGRMFGSSHSLYDLRTQDMVVKDWRGMKEREETLARLLDTQITMNAAELNRTDLIPHIEIDDERHKSMRNRMYAESLSFLSEIARGIHMLNIGATHWYDSLRQGEVGSADWNLGDLIITNSGLRIYGSLPNDERTKQEVRDKERITAAEVAQLTTLGNRFFGAKLQGEARPMTFFRTLVHPDLVEAVMKTESANAGMTKQEDLRSAAFLRRYAADNGLPLNR